MTSNEWKFFLHLPFIFICRMFKMLLLWSIWYMCCGRSGCWKDRTCRGLEGNGWHWMIFNIVTKVNILPINGLFQVTDLRGRLLVDPYWSTVTNGVTVAEEDMQVSYNFQIKLYIMNVSKEYYLWLYASLNLESKFPFRDWKPTFGRHQMPMSEINLLVMDKTYE